MRYAIFTAVLLSAQIATAAEPPAPDLRSFLRRLETESHKALCPLLAGGSECRFEYLNVTQNHLGGGDSLLGIAFRIASTDNIKLKPSEQEALRAKVRDTGAQILVLDKRQVEAIRYFRLAGKAILPLTQNAFAREALNPFYKVVARVSPAFLTRGYTFTYSLPEETEKEGLAASSRFEIRLGVRGNPPLSPAFRITDLDDKSLPSVTLSDCKATQAEGEATWTCLVTAARKIKSEQPAFKLVMTDASLPGAVVQLAIPFRPQPNYFLFGVVGFLFGGLIAVMVLIMRRKPNRA